MLANSRIRHDFSQPFLTQLGACRKPGLQIPCFPAERQRGGGASLIGCGSLTGISGTQLGLDPYCPGCRSRGGLDYKAHAPRPKACIRVLGVRGQPHHHHVPTNGISNPSGILARRSQSFWRPGGGVGVQILPPPSHPCYPPDGQGSRPLPHAPLSPLPPKKSSFIWAMFTQPGPPRRVVVGKIDHSII